MRKALFQLLLYLRDLDPLIAAQDVVGLFILLIIAHHIVILKFNYDVYLVLERDQIEQQKAINIDEYKTRLQVLENACEETLFTLKLIAGAATVMYVLFVLWYFW